MKFNEIFEGRGSSVAARQVWNMIGGLQQQAGRHRAILKQTLRVMKLTTIIMTLFLLQVTAATRAQISLNAKGESLQKVLKDIAKQSGYDFIYADQDVKNLKVFNLKLSNVSVEQALKACLDQQPVIYEISDKTVMIQRKEEKGVLDRLKDYFASIDVRGKVVDVNGQPLSGASITVKGTGKTVSADNDGSFSISGIAEDAVLVITYIGYQPREVAAKSDLSKIVMEQVTNPLDMVQVQAYGTTSRRLGTGNISTIKAKDLEKQPVNNVLLALSGQLPGVQITQNTGLPGTGVAIRIQGENSLGNGKNPFFIIDGIPYISTLPDNRASGILRSGGNLGGGGNPFSFLNPADIESIDVLKDADAIAIYGSRAANGAILITTKKGKAGKTKVDFTLQSGFGKVAKKLDMMNTQQYLELRKEAFKNDGLSIPTSASTPANNNYDLTTYDQNRYTDWQKELTGGSASYTDVQGAISGGDAQTSFRFSTGFHKETTVFPTDLADQKGSFAFNLNHTSENKKFHFQASANYLVDRNNLSTVDLTKLAITLPPNAPALYKGDGSLNWARIASGTDSVSTWTNPLSQLQGQYKTNVNNLVTNANLSYSIIDQLNFKTSFGYSNLMFKDVSTGPLTTLRPELRATNSASATYSNSNVETWIVEPQLTYDLTALGGKFNVLAGMTFQQNKTNQINQLGSGFSSDLALEDIKGAASTTILGSSQVNYKYAAIFGRLNYNFNDTYLLNFTLRRDGSSRFGSASQFHTFYGIGGAWVLSNEKFFKNKISFISFAKIKSSYGTSGNDQFADYSFLSLSTVQSPAIAYQGTTGLLPNGLSNPSIQWELTKKYNIGLDIGILNDRILFGANFYKNRTSNQLLSYALPSTTGFTSVQLNFPATLENRGFEFNVSTINIRGVNFSWSSNLNFTIPKNTLVDFPGIEKSTYSQLIIGQPSNITRNQNYAGVDPKTGLYQFRTVNGSLTAAPTAADRTFIYTPNQKYYGGLQNSFTYKKITFDFLFQFVKQMGTNLNGTWIRIGEFSGASSFGNMPTWYADRWQNVGDIATYQKASTTIFNVQTSGLNLTDASY
ncbi:MAG: SusC/RagA family TonB-linked outer membrane protein, partial [Sphingobacteriales bacterium]